MEGLGRSQGSHRLELTGDDVHCVSEDQILDNDDHRRRATLDLQAVSPNAMLSTDGRHQGHRCHANLAPITGFRLQTTTNLK